MIRLTTNKNFIFFMAVYGIAIGNAGSTLYLPALVNITHKLNTTSGLVKLSLASYLLTFALSQLIYGPISDSIGRKKVLLTGLGIFLAGSIIICIANTISIFILGRLVEGFGIGAANAVGYAIVRDIFSGHELIKKVSYVSVCVGLVPIIAPLCGGYLVEYINWQACFIFLSLLVTSLISIEYLQMPETNLGHTHKMSLQDIANNYLNLITNQNYLAATLVGSIAFSSLFSLNSILPFIIIKHLNVAPALYGWLTLIMGIGYFSGSFVGGILATRFSIEFTIRSGIWIQIVTAIIGLIVALIYFNIAVVIIPLFFILFGVGLIVPTSVGKALALFPELAGSASALFGTSMFGTAAVFTSIIAHISTNNQIQLFMFLLGLSIISGICYFSIYKRSI